MKAAVQQKTRQMYRIAELLRMAQSEGELVALLGDLLTDSEVNKMYERVQIVSYLMEGMSQREVAEKTGAGIATVTRGASVIRNPECVLTRLIDQERNGRWQEMPPTSASAA